MDAESILNRIGAKQGWDLDSKLALCLRYIERQQSNDAFEDFLGEEAQFENDEAAANEDPNNGGISDRERI